jgi:hypothetical protein
MGKPGRKGNAQVRYRAEAALIAKYGSMSTRQLADKLYEEYGLKVSHGQVSLDLKQDIESLSEKEIDEKKSSLLKELEDTIEAAKNISRTDENNNTRLKAMDTYNKLIQTQAKILAEFEKIKMQLQEKERPIYNISIGKPVVATKGDVKNGKGKRGAATTTE